MTARDEKPCPACSESILVSAQKCKHCGEFPEDWQEETDDAEENAPVDTQGKDLPLITRIIFELGDGLSEILRTLWPPLPIHPLAEDVRGMLTQLRWIRRILIAILAILALTVGAELLNLEGIARFIRCFTYNIPCH